MSFSPRGELRYAICAAWMRPKIRVELGVVHAEADVMTLEPIPVREVEGERLVHEHRGEGPLRLLPGDAEKAGERFGRGDPVVGRNDGVVELDGHRAPPPGALSRVEASIEGQCPHWRLLSIPSIPPTSARGERRKRCPATTAQASSARREPIDAPRSDDRARFRCSGARALRTRSLAAARDADGPVCDRASARRQRERQGADATRRDHRPAHEGVRQR